MTTSSPSIYRDLHEVAYVELSVRRLQKVSWETSPPIPYIPSALCNESTPPTFRKWRDLPTVSSSVNKGIAIILFLKAFTTRYALLH